MAYKYLFYIARITWWEELMLRRKIHLISIDSFELEPTRQGWEMQYQKMPKMVV